MRKLSLVIKNSFARVADIQPKTNTEQFVRSLTRRGVETSLVYTRGNT
jgi:hypothetical protein